MAFLNGELALKLKTPSTLKNCSHMTSRLRVILSHAIKSINHWSKLKPGLGRANCCVFH